ncbi:MAG: RusA family crossover junction endodeoxyribonuclease [Deltaproteobacteria bacterium]
MIVHLEIPLRAVPKGRARYAGHHYTPTETREFQDRFRFELMQILHRLPYKFEPFAGRLEVTLELLPDSTIVHIAELNGKKAKGAPAGDLDNLEKAILDSCQSDKRTGWAGLFKNDSQIDSIWVKR